MIDTHVHLDDVNFDRDRDYVINSLLENDITRVYNIGSDIVS